MNITLGPFHFSFDNGKPIDRDVLFSEVPKIQQAACMLSYAALAMDPYEAKVPENAVAGMQRITEIIQDYSVNGVLPDSSSDNDAMFLDFMAFCKAARAAEELFSVKASAAPIERLMAMAILRNRLDAMTSGKTIDAQVLEPQSEYFTLNEISVLGQMHEKTVRNATQTRAVDRLNTFKQGAKTLVTADEAARWLGNRRNFKPTTLKEGIS